MSPLRGGRAARCVGDDTTVPNAAEPPAICLVRNPFPIDPAVSHSARRGLGPVGRASLMQRQQPQHRRARNPRLTRDFRRGEACLALPAPRGISPDRADLASQPPSGGFLPSLLRLQPPGASPRSRAEPILSLDPTLLDPPRSTGLLVAPGSIRPTPAPAGPSPSSPRAAGRRSGPGAWGPRRRARRRSAPSRCGGPPAPPG
jgi:hypothetical protein